MPTRTWPSLNRAAKAIFAIYLLLLPNPANAITLTLPLTFPRRGRLPQAITTYGARYDLCHAAGPIEFISFSFAATPNRVCGAANTSFWVVNFAGAPPKVQPIIKDEKWTLNFSNATGATWANFQVFLVQVGGPYKIPPYMKNAICSIGVRVLISEVSNGQMINCYLATGGGVGLPPGATLAVGFDVQIPKPTTPPIEYYYLRVRAI